MANQKREKIGLFTAISIVAGSIIGSGIFMKPATMAAQTGSNTLLLMAWLIGGFFSLCGVLLFAELSSMYPRSGGLYIYLKEMYGDFAAYYYGWSAFAVINTAAVAAIAVICASYSNFFLNIPELPKGVWHQWELHLPFIGRFYPLQNIGVKALAIAIVLSLSWLNAKSLKQSGRLQNMATVLKIAAIVLLVGIILSSSAGKASNWASNTLVDTSWTKILSLTMVALTGAFMSYDGWQNITFLGSEIDKPEKNLPRSLIYGVVICIVVYLLINLAYTFVLPVNQMAESQLVASDAIQKASGKTAAGIIAALVALSTFGCVNGNVMAVSRVTYAMAAEGDFFRHAGKLSSRSGTPANAIWWHAVWSSLFILSGTFDMLADMFVFLTWLFILLATVGLILLRIKKPGARRPFKLKSFGLLATLFIAFCIYYLGSVVIFEVNAFASGQADVINSLLSVMITLPGIPLYFYFKRKYRKA